MNCQTNPAQHEPVHHEVARYPFDNYNSGIRPLNGASYISIVEDYDSDAVRMNIVIDNVHKMSMNFYLDQWGIYMQHSIGDEQVTVAHECGTKPYLDALIAALLQARSMTAGYHNVSDS